MLRRPRGGAGASRLPDRQAVPKHQLAVRQNGIRKHRHGRVNLGFGAVIFTPHTVFRAPRRLFFTTGFSIFGTWYVRRSRPFGFSATRLVLDTSSPSTHCSTGVAHAKRMTPPPAKMAVGMPGLRRTPRAAGGTGDVGVPGRTPKPLSHCPAATRIAQQEGHFHHERRGGPRRLGRPAFFALAGL
jgi:hypothetical protein